MTTSTEATLPECQSDITFILHYRKDCPDREHNLVASTRYLVDKFPDSPKIIVYDGSEFDKGMLSVIPDEDNINVVFLKNDDEFRKSLAFNEAADQADTNVLCFWDVDVLIDKRFIYYSYYMIETWKDADHVYPFNGTFIDVQKDLFQDFLTRYNFSHVNKLWEHKHPSLHFASGTSPGGCTMISREAFDRMEGYDSRFIGWGFEDTDFLYRSRKVNRVSYLEDKDAICWHLHHENAKRTENPHYMNNLRIFNENASR